MPNISPLASVHPDARIADDVEIGPFCLVGPDITLGAGCRLINSVTLDGHVHAGSGNVFHPYSVIGGPPQDLKYKQSPTLVEIGNDNTFRELVTVNRATEIGRQSKESPTTRIGDDNLIMAGVHIGHNSTIGSGVILTNNVLLAGHVDILDNAILGGAVGVRQKVTIGERAFITAMTRVIQDVPPYCLMDGPTGIRGQASRVSPFRGANKRGLLRAGFAKPDITLIDTSLKQLFKRDGKEDFSAKLDQLDQDHGTNVYVGNIIQFLRSRTVGRDGRARDSSMQLGR